MNNMSYDLSQGESEESKAGHEMKWKIIITGVQLTSSSQKHSMLLDTFHSFMTSFSFFITSAATLATYFILFYSCEFSVKAPNWRILQFCFFFGWSSTKCQKLEGRSQWKIPRPYPIAHPEDPVCLKGLDPALEVLQRWVVLLFLPTPASSFPGFIWWERVAQKQQMLRCYWG